MKAEDITIAHYSEYSAVYVNGDYDSSYHRAWMPDCRERAEKRRQELIDALPKPHWSADTLSSGGMMYMDRSCSWSLPYPLVPHRDRILAMLNEAEE